MRFVAADFATRLPGPDGERFAGVGHRFEDFSEDLAVWVIFYGPEGGEQV